MSGLRDFLNRVPPTRKSPAEESVEEVARLEAKADEIREELAEREALAARVGLPKSTPLLTGTVYPQLPCGHRYWRALRPGEPAPPLGDCSTCVREAEAKQQADDTPRVMIDLGPSGLRPARNEPPWTAREYELLQAWEEDKIARGEVLPNSSEERDALHLMDMKRQEADERERIKNLPPEERHALAMSRNRRQLGFTGGTVGTYVPSPAKAQG